MAESYKVGQAPWETEDSFKVGQAPWEIEDSEAPGDIVVNEMHPAIDFTTRLVYKNFGANPEASFNYLQKKHPELEWKKDASGEPIARAQGETEWRKLDPSGFDIQDLSDIAYDVPSSVAQGAATAGAGLAGGAATAGLGAIPSAMAASSASGTALEGLRQGLGSMMGIENNLSGSDLGWAAGAGAISPLLFGTGASAKAAMKVVGGTSKEAAKDLLKTQRGLVGKAYDKTAGVVGPKLASLLGGYKEETIKAAAENMPLIDAAAKEPKVAINVLEEGKDKLISGIQSKLDDTGKQIENITGSLDQAGPVIDTKTILAPIEQLKTKLKTSGIASEDRKQLIQQLEDMVQRNFGVTTKGAMDPFQLGAQQADQVIIPEKVTATQANEMYFSLKALMDDAGVNMKNLGTTKSVTTGGMSDKRVQRALLQSTKTAKDSIKKLADDSGVGKEYRAAHDAYTQLKGFQDDLFNATKTDEAYQRFLNKNNSSARFAKQQVSEIIGEDVNKLGAKMQAIELFATPQWEIPSFGMSNTGRTVAASALGGAAGYTVGKTLNDGATFLPSMIGAIGGKYAAGPKAIKGMIKTNQALREAPQMLGYQSLPYLMMNLSQDKGKD